MTTPKLAEVDLSPIRETIVDLLGRTTPEKWQPFGDCYSTRAGEPLTDDVHAKTIAAFALAEKVTRTSKENLLSFLASRGITDWIEAPRSTLKSRAICAMYDAWFPRHFINPKVG